MCGRVKQGGTKPNQTKPTQVMHSHESDPYLYLSLLCKALVPVILLLCCVFPFLNRTMGSSFDSLSFSLPTAFTPTSSHVLGRLYQGYCSLFKASFVFESFRLEASFAKTSFLILASSSTKRDMGDAAKDNCFLPSSLDSPALLLSSLILDIRS